VTFLLRSVHVGRPRPREWAELGHTAIQKHPVDGPVRALRLGLDGDQVGDTKHHGGVDQAVYAFSREDLDRWTETLGQPIADGQFGENLTTSGYDINAAEIGETWRVGTVLLEVASMRTPCNDFKGWMGELGFDNTAWVKRFAATARPGPYLRVLEEGVLQAGDAISVVHRPGHGVTVSHMFRALTTERELLPDLLVVEGLVEEARRTAAEYVARLPDQPLSKHA
jgi:MOSC domain-containing protein YiiM